MTPSSLADAASPFSLAGRTACVTGAGRGLGAAIAEALAGAGAKMVLMARSASELAVVKQSIEGRGGEAIAVPCDVCDDDAVRNAFSALPMLDILVNNAGMNRPGPMQSTTGADLDAVIGLNVRASYIVAQAAIAKMLEQPQHLRMPGGSAIVHITSQMGRVGAANRTVYCMTKHAIEGLSKAMAVEFAGQGVRVNCVAPTFLDTPMTAPFFAKDPAFADWVLRRIPMGRLGTVEEVARTVLFVASPAASLTTGESLAVDGGWTAQ